MRAADQKNESWGPFILTGNPKPAKFNALCPHESEAHAFLNVASSAASFASPQIERQVSGSLYATIVEVA